MKDSLLASLGLSPNEVRVYNSVLKLGEVTPAALAKATGIKRTTAYSIARGLAEKGLLVEDTTRRPRTFTGATPSQVRDLLRVDKKRIEERGELLKTLADELQNRASKSTYSVPTVRFIEEGKIDDFMRHQTTLWDKSIAETGETTWWGFQDHTFVEEYSDWILWYWNRFPEGVDLKLLSNRAEVEVKFAPKIGERRQIKFWGEATNFHSTTWAIGDYLVLINTRVHPFYLVEIHDKLLAHDQREVYRNLWPLVP